MKTRSSFVSNSSSSSFIINKKNLTDEQVYKIKNHIQEAIKTPNYSELFDYADKDDAWNIIENEEEIGLSTTMDNFDMEEWLEYIGLKEGKDFLAFD